jgi:amino acid transporter
LSDETDVMAVDGVGAGEKGLKKNAIGFISSVVIGVASTAPGYSLAAVLGFVVAAEAAGGSVGFQAPAIMIVAFIPMLFIAAAYYYMNRADPDCGTTFSWVTKAMGPHLGWLGGWAIIVADIIVMANLAQIAGLYTFLLFGWESAAASTAAVTAVGVVWIAVMTVIVVVSIELSARTQMFLLSAEIVTLVLFAVIALVKVYTTDVAGSVTPELSWFNPFAIDSFGAMTAGVLIAVFIYWGWDSAVTVNEETEDSSQAPGKAAVVSTVLLVLIYVVVSAAAQAWGGVDKLAENSDDVLSALGTEVFGSPWDKILIIAVLTSAAASTQTTILPTSRTALSMARNKALPRYFGEVHTRYLTPANATWWMGGLSIAWYVGLTIVSENILYDSIAALGLMIAFYYGLTGFACAIYYRRQLFDSVRNFFFIGVLPTIGGLILTWVFIKSCVDFWDPANSESGDSWFGVGPPLVIGVGFLLLGVVLVAVGSFRSPEFFKRKTETASPHVVAGAPATPTPLGGE